MKSTNLDNALRRMYRAAEAIQLLTKDGMENDILDEISLSRYCLILRHTKRLCSAINYVEHAVSADK